MRFSAFNVAAATLLHLTSALPSQLSTTQLRSRAVSSVGITYLPYTANGNCKSNYEISADLISIGPSYDLIRLRGTDCNQVANVLSAARAQGFKLFLTIPNTKSLNSDLSTIVSSVGGDWGSIDTVSVGNELIYSGVATLAQVLSALSTARSTLRQHGFTGPVVAVDLPETFISNPSLGAASDYIAVNIEPFYSSITTAANAGAYVASQISVLSGVAAGKSVVVTEVGWPKYGNCNGVACPSTANQKAALDSVRATLSGRVIFYAAFDHRWNSEYWGLVGSYSF